MRNKLIGSLLIISLSAGFTVPANANPAETHHQIAVHELDTSLASNAYELEKALELINSIPDEVLLAGDEATLAWFEEHAQSGQFVEEASIWECSLAIGELLVTTALPAARLLKIKRLIRDLGGSREAVQIMWGASFRKEKLLAMGGTIRDLVLELSGIALVQEKCFS